MASFPNSIKQFTTWKNIGDPTEPQGDTVFAFHVNEIHDEVFAIETTLGANPQGSAASVSARLAVLEAGKSSGGHTHPQYMIPIGSCFVFPNPGAPTGSGLNVLYNGASVFLLCNGASFSGVTYPDLATFLGSTTLPDFRNVLAMGAGTLVALGATAGAATAVISSSQLPTHVHTVTDIGHAHGTTVAPHQHSVSDGGINDNRIHITQSGPQNNYTPATPVPASPPVGSQPDTMSHINPATVSVGVNAAGSSVSVNPAGSSTAMPILNPVLGVNWFIKALTVP